jgi:peptidoglycan/xylan/chitin deacetylase (PgdA/CDA1 family)
VWRATALAVWLALPGVLGFVDAAGQAGSQPASARSVAITFDDLPETSDVPRNSSRLRIARQLIAELKMAKAPQVYGFVNAGTLDDPEVTGILERWRAAGFLLGNHTYTHWNLDEKPLPVYERDIARNEPVLRHLMPGQDWHWFRYPFLAEGATIEKREGLRTYLAAHGYRIAEVTINFEDDAWNDPYARCVAHHNTASIERMKTMYMAAAAQSLRFASVRSNQLFQRDIPYVMLLHMGGFAPVMLPRLLDLLQTQGYALITLPEAESDPVYAMDPKIANNGGTLLDDLMEASEQKDGPHTLPPREALAKMCR